MKAFSRRLNEKIFISFLVEFRGLSATTFWLLILLFFTGKDEGQFLHFPPRQFYRHQGSPHQFSLVWSCLRLLCLPLPPQKFFYLCRQKSRLKQKRLPFHAHFPSFSFQRGVVRQTSHKQAFRSQFHQQGPYFLHSCKFRSVRDTFTLLLAFARRLGL